MSIFNNSKYSKWYFSIIESARNRIVNSYTEKHHVIPKSLGGSNDLTNLVRLTPKEHFICHLLLIKMTSGNAKNKMVYAAWTMTWKTAQTKERYKVTSRQFDSLRNQISKTRKGKKFSEEHKQKLREAAKTRVKTKRKVSSLKGCSRPDTVKEKISKTVTQRHIEKGHLIGRRPKSNQS